MEREQYCFGVDIGGTTVKMGLFHADGELLHKWEIPTRRKNNGEAILPDITASIFEKIEEYHIVKEDVIGIGIGVPTAVTADGRAKKTTNIGWPDKNIKQEMEERTGFKVNVGNDANVAALGEMWQGGGAGYQNLVLVTLGTGVGGGIIINGRIVTGAHGGAGEIGHLFMNVEETEYCGCGKQGCLEQYASATGIARFAKQKNMGDVTAKDVFDGVKAGDKVAIEVAEEFGAYLGYALANIAAVVDPEIFVIGGGVSKAGEVLFEYIEKYYMEKAFWAHKEAKFTLATLGNDAGIYGAAKLALE